MAMGRVGRLEMSAMVIIQRGGRRGEAEKTLHSLCLLLQARKFVDV
jgi:hypothetical protein